MYYYHSVLSEYYLATANTYLCKNYEFEYAKIYMT